MDGPQTSKLQPPPQPNSSRRPRPAMFRVWAPDGTEHLHTQSNARDLVRHAGWSARPPGHVEPTGSSGDAEPAGREPEAAPEASSRGVIARQANSRLTPLREECERLGIPIDNRWGVKRLTEEIEYAKSAANAEPNTADDAENVRT